MCLSAEVSFIAAAGLIPAGALSMRQAWRGDRRYLPLATLPLLFGLQQLAEGVVWVAGAGQNAELITSASLVYMFFSWLAWPVWIPVSTFTLEPARRKPYFLAFVIVGAMLGALQYVPYFAHADWLSTRFLSHVIIYEGTELLDFVGRREITYAIYISATPIIIGTRCPDFWSAGIWRARHDLYFFRLCLCVGLLFRRRVDVILSGLDDVQRRRRVADAKRR